MNGRPVRVLLVEDDLFDSVLVTARLSFEGSPFVVTRVETQEDYRAVLSTEPPDIILSDYKLPRFSGELALQIRHEMHKDAIPFIFVSGTIGEERAVELMRNGATDFVMKDHLDNLRSAVERALREVSEQLRRAEELQRQYEQLHIIREISNAVPVPIFLRDSNGLFVECNRSFARFFGIARESLAGKKSADILPADVTEFDSKVDAEQVSLDTEHRHVCRIATSEGKLHDVQYVRSSFRQPDGSFVGILGALIDLTEQKENERAARRSLALQEAVFRNLDSAVIVVNNPTRTIALINPGVERIFEFTEEELLGKSTRLFHIDDKHFVEFEQLTGQSFDSDNVFHTEYSFIRKSGEEFSADVSVAALDDRMSRSGQLVIIIRDITDRKRTEEQLLNRQAEIETLLDNAPDLIMRTDRRLNILFVNSVFERLTGLSAKEITGKPLSNMIEMLGVPFDRVHSWVQQVSDVFSDGVSTLVDFQLTVRGRITWLQSRVVPEFSADGSVRTAMSITRDITEQVEAQEALKHAEADLRRSQRMESVGRLAGGVAHDFNNILTAISGYAMFARQDMDPDSQIGKYIAQVLVNVERAARLTRQLLLFSRNTPTQMSSFDLTRTVRETARMLERLIGENIKLVIEADEPLRPIVGDASKIEQVFMNLVINARDAMPAGGTIQIRLKNVVLDSGETASIPEHFVELSVTDTGSGMGPEVIEHIFEPFFTTKARERGTGLGLAVVHGIVAEHSGTVTVDSAPTKGTRFTIRFPAPHSEGRQTEEQQFTAAPSPGSRGRVLLIEDEPDILSILAVSLDHAGHQTATASTIAEAIEVWENSEQPFDAAIIDMVLPDGSGLDFLESIRVIQNTKFIFVSGYIEDSRDFHIVRDRGYRFVQKPYSIHTILSVLQEELSRKSRLQ